MAGILYPNSNTIAAVGGGSRAAQRLVDSRASSCGRLLQSPQPGLQEIQISLEKKSKPDSFVVTEKNAV